MTLNIHGMVNQFEKVYEKFIDETLQSLQLYLLPFPDHHPCIGRFSWDSSNFYSLKLKVIYKINPVQTNYMRVEYNTLCNSKREILIKGVFIENLKVHTYKLSYATFLDSN